MKTRYRLICRGIRGGAYYCVDTKTGKRTSLGTTNADDARQVIEAKNNSERQPVLNLQIAKAYLAGSDNGNHKTPAACPPFAAAASAVHHRLDFGFYIANEIVRG
jgi:hypothetical protein